MSDDAPYKVLHLRDVLEHCPPISDEICQSTGDMFQELMLTGGKKKLEPMSNSYWQTYVAGFCRSKPTGRSVPLGSTSNATVFTPSRIRSGG